LSFETVTEASASLAVSQGAGSLKSSSRMSSPMPVRKSVVGLTCGVGNGEGVSVGGNQTGVGVGVELAVGVGVEVGAAGGAKQPTQKSKRLAARIVFGNSGRFFTTRYYSFAPRALPVQRISKLRTYAHTSPIKNPQSHRH
jgi:hypothetical protein